MKTLRPLTKIALLALTLGLVGATVYVAQKPSPLRVDCPVADSPPYNGENGVCHPYPQPRLSASTADTVDGVIRFNTGTTFFDEPAIDPFTKPPGTNFLPNVYTNMYDGNGQEMLNTLPSTPAIPYNLHDDPAVSTINKTSPTDDLARIFASVLADADSARQRGPRTEIVQYAIEDIKRDLQTALNVLEGYPVQNRAYSGFPLLHYTGPEDVRRVIPIFNDNGLEVVGGNIDVHQIWYDGHIESDLALLNPVDVWNVPWTMTYTVDVLHNGHDDFSPFAIFTDDPSINNPDSTLPPLPQPFTTPPTAWNTWPAGLPHIGMDQTFFPMEDGTRTVFKVKMPPGRYFHLIYTWGWRMHPPRIQSTDRATKYIFGKSLVEWETEVFGEAPIRQCQPDEPRYAANGDPMPCQQKSVDAINKIGDYSPAKLMWKAVRDAKTAAAGGHFDEVITSIKAARDAFFAWKDRSTLPCFARDESTGECLNGLDPDPDSDITILFVNNTIYGQLTKGGWTQWPDWNLRYTAGEDTTLNNPVLDVTVHNGDYFEHAYQNIDFGGSRGWENQFKSSVRVGGSGCWFTFGRAHWWPNNKTPVMLKAATQSNPLVTQKVQITYNYEPSRRLRFYQFDPLHHDVAIYSIH